MNKPELEKKINTVIIEVVDQIGYVSSIDVLIQLGYLSQTDYENWRKGKIEYLERVCYVSLGKLATINRLIKKISEKMKLEPSWTAYNKFGKEPKVRLQFSKTGDINIEKAYSTHYVNKYRINQLNELKSNPIQEEENHMQVTSQHPKPGRPSDSK